MRTRSSFLIAIAAMLIAGTSLGIIFFRPNPSSAAPSSVVGRELTVVGLGVARGAPDTAMIHFAVQTHADSARTALRENTAKMQGLLVRLKELKIPDSAIQTSSFSIHTMHDGPSPAPVRYQASNNVTVTLDNVDKASTVLEEVVEAGGNTIVNLTFSLAKPEALEQAARDEAIATARARAEAMAKASGATLGQLLRITESFGASPASSFAEGGAVLAVAAPPILPGEHGITAYVQATFELK